MVLILYIRHVYPPVLTFFNFFVNPKAMGVDKISIVAYAHDETREFQRKGE